MFAKIYVKKLNKSIKINHVHFLLALLFKYQHILCFIISIGIMFVPINSRWFNITTTCFIKSATSISVLYENSKSAIYD